MQSTALLGLRDRSRIQSSDWLDTPHIRTARPEIGWEVPEIWHEKPRLLIGVADDAVSSLCEQFFTEQGFAVETGWCGLSCVELLKTWSPHALILESDLPWGGGDGIVARLREESRYTQIPVLLLVRDAALATRRPHPAPIAGVFGPPYDFAAMTETLRCEIPELFASLLADEEP